MTYAEWRKSNLAIVVGVMSLAKDMQRRGYRHWSAWAAVNVLRWQTAIRDNTQLEYKIPNDRIADMAREVNERLGCDFFRTKRRKDGSL